MQSVKSAGTVFQNKRRRFLLSVCMAQGPQFRESMWKTDRQIQPFRPFVGNRGEFWINRFASGLNKLRQRIFVIFIFAESETMPFHNDGLAKNRPVVIRDEFVAIFVGQ